MSIKHSSAKKHIVVGKLYSNGCIYCRMLEGEWNKMINKLANDLHLKLDTDKHADLSEYRKFVSNDGNTVVEIIQIEDANMEKDIPYVNEHYLTQLEMPNHVPVLFRIGENSDLRYYDGERTVNKMKDFYYASLLKKVRGTRRKKRQNKTKKNKTRVRYH